MKTRKRRIAACKGAAAAIFACSALAAVPRDASAQTKTFHLDRLEVPGAPDDGIAIFRPATQQRTMFFGQMALGYSLRPLKVTNITSDDTTIKATKRSSVIQDQFTVYGTAGFELLDRAIFALSFPWSPIQTGENPVYPPPGVTAGGKQLTTTTITPDGPSAGDLRIDFRGTLYRTDDRKGAFGAQLSIFAPTGTISNFGGDNGTSAMFMLTGERTIKIITLIANLGVHFRPRHAINDPKNESGLGIGNELRWALGGMIPIKDGKYRVGLTFFGQTGIESDDTILGDTPFRKANTPIEWQVEGRMKFGPSDHWWLGAGAGSRFFFNAYGSPDFRFVALLGTYVPIGDSDAKSPEPRQRHRNRDVGTQDRDHDGIPDDIDACPDEPEDHLGNDPNDGCPQPADRDGDGIPDNVDKCPDQPEDKDGIDDGDGCPEDDFDNDGIPDTVDACPKEPGSKNADPKKNGCPSFIKVEGNVVRILQQVHFQTGSDVILPDSFPMLQEITNLLKANKGIKKMSIEGHTDNRGAADMNKNLSQRRANSVMNWLAQHGVENSRLEAHGYGLEKPIDTNDTDQGRAANRRVEFKILDEDDGNGPKKQ